MNEMIEVARNSVQTCESDQMGHMNVQFYMDKAAGGLAALGVHLGLGPRRTNAPDTQLVAFNHHVRFLRELLPGAPYYMRAGIVGVQDEQLRVYQEMVHTVSDEVAATFTGDVALLEGCGADPRPLSAAVEEKARTLLIDLPVHGRPRGLELHEPRRRPSMEEAEALGMVPTLQCEVQAIQCDVRGYLLTRHYMGSVSDAIPNLLAHIHDTHRNESPDVGGAALEYRLIYHARPRAGDILVLRSGLKEVTTKTYTWCHWLFDLETGQAVATAEAVAVSLDLQARKSIPIPEAMYDRLQGLIIPGLSV